MEEMQLVYFCVDSRRAPGVVYRYMVYINARQHISAFI